MTIENTAGGIEAANEDSVERSVHRIVIKAPIDDVWAELCATGRPQPYFFGGVRHSQGWEVGNAFAMRTPNGKLTSVVGEILEIDPPHRFVYSFKFTNFDDPPCKVIQELKEVDGGTELILTSEFGPGVIGTRTAKQMAQGGSFIVKTLKAVMEQGQPSFGTRILLGVISMTGFMAPKQSASVHWGFDQIREKLGSSK